jgi:rSAM/selenodomain-associated transferase 1
MGQVNTGYQALLVFIKNPVLGKAKTRLAATVGDEEAMRIYLKLLSHTRQQASRVKAVRLLFYSHFVDGDDEWDNQYFSKYLQSGEDLGSRMDAGFEEGFRQAGKVVVIGSDCPRISTEIIKEAFLALEKSEIVIGPSLDGGYYLLGMAKHYPSLFEGVEWSTDVVFQQTLARCEALGIRPAILPKLPDVDYWEDWERWGW